MSDQLSEASRRGISKRLENVNLAISLTSDPKVLADLQTLRARLIAQLNGSYWQ